MKAERFTDPVAFHGEGAFWDGRGQRLLMVDLLAGDVVEIDADAHSTAHHVGTVADVVRQRASGGFIVAVEHGFVFTDDELVVRERLPEVISDPLVRLNEGGCDPQGRFYCGSMAYSEAPGGGTLYRLDTDLAVTTVLPVVSISNGLQWSADGTRVFYNDTPTGRVDVFDFEPDTGAFLNRRPFAALEPGQNPDGMAIDDEDGLWIALFSGGGVLHVDRDGRVVDLVELPVSQVTSCAFGGPDRDTLFITTSRLFLEPGEQPDAGAVFAVRPGVRGPVPFAFAG